MKYEVSLDGEKFVVEIVTRDGRRYARVGGREEPVDFRRVRGTGSYSLLVGNASFPVSLEARPDGVSITVESESYVALVEDERSLALKSAITGRGGAPAARTIFSMMPGIVREVRVTAGETVGAGQPLVILEAMKMQNEIRAVAAGSVKQVHVLPETTVNKGDPLVTLA